MNIDDLTLGQIKQIQAMTSNVGTKTDSSAWEIGKPYLIRTVTMIDTGRVVGVTEHEIIWKTPLGLPTPDAFRTP